MRGLIRPFAVLLIGAVALALPSPAHAQLWTESGEKWFSEIPDLAVSGSYGILLTNEGTTGTANTLLACYAAVGLAITCPTSTTLEVLGPVLKDGGTTGKAVIGSTGIGPCQFDGATTAGNYVQLSTTVDGNCHDVGAAFPTSGGRVIGTAVTTNGASGVYSVHMYPRGIQAAREVTGFVTADVWHAQSSTTLSDITGLAFTACTTATEVWHFEVSLVLYATGDTVPDWKFGWSYPAGTSIMMWGGSSATTTLDHWGVVGTASSPLTALGMTDTLVHGSVGQNHLLHLRGVLLCSSASSGPVQLRFAQNSSDASTNIVTKGSMLIARKVVP